MLTPLELVLMLLALAVMMVVTFRSFGLPPILGYLVVGVAIGPHAFNLLSDSGSAAHLAEFGVVFLLFSIGLEFSLPRLYSMKRIVFGLGAAQVLLTTTVAILIARDFGLGWVTGFALGSAVTMSSTAVLSRLLSERLELDSRHGREVIGVLLFQDLAVVPLLILLPVLTEPAEMAEKLGLAALKAAVVLGGVIFFGQKLMRAWFFIVARRKSSELFVLNVLLITLGLAWITELAGLSLALGAFVAGMLISETEYRYQVEEDIKPFREVLLGLFFITIGMLLDLAEVIDHLPWVLLVLVLILAVKLILVAGLSRAFGASPGSALRSGLWLCAGGEFGFVLLALIRQENLATDAVLQVILAAMVLSLLLAPLIIHFSDRIVLRLVASEWLLRSMQLTQIAARTISSDKHAILCGYGRTGQHLARFLEQEGVAYVALDLDPDRVHDAAVAGESVSFGDSARSETLVAAGIARASVMVITFADRAAALRVIHHARALRPDLPIVVRALLEEDVDRLIAAGATEVVPEALESSVMLATHALALLGVPMSRVIRRLRDMREQRYVLLRGFFHGASDAEDGLEEEARPRLLPVTLSEGAWAVGRLVTDLGLEALGCQLSTVRSRRYGGHKRTDPLAEGDVVVLLGVPATLSAGETRLLMGR